MSKSNYIIPIFVPHLGCPHDCVFCNQEEITGVKKRTTKDEVIKKIDDYLSTIPKEAKQIEVAFYGGSFTGINPKYQKELLSATEQRLKEGSITGVRLSTRPDYIDKKILNYLQKYGITAIELGVQSLDDKVLKASGRGHTSQEVIEAVQLIRNYNFKLGLQIMPGLPESTVESDLKTGAQIIELNPDFVRIYPTLVIRGTKLAQLYKNKEYRPLDLEEAVEITARLLRKFKEVDVPVIRIGLQPSEGVNQEEVLAGPFHPAFRQLVESKLILNKLKEKITGLTIKELELIVNPKDISNLRGQRNSNLDYLYRNYNLEQIIISSDANVDRGEVIVNFK